MKCGDIVTISDGSYCLCYAGQGELHHIFGNNLLNRRWTVLCRNLRLPSDVEGEWNDLLLCEVDNPANLLFSRARHCLVVVASDPNAIHVTVPAGTTKLIVAFER